MIGNMLNDLAKAFRRVGRKKVCMSPNLYHDSELPYIFTKIKRTTPSKARFVPPSVPLVVFWSPWCVTLLDSWDRCCVVFLSVRLVVFLVLLRSSLCLGGPCWFCLVVRLSFGSSLCPFCFPPPAVCPVWCPHLVFAGTSLWVSGCSFCACLFCMCCFLVLFWFCFLCCCCFCFLVLCFLFSDERDSA